MTPTPSPRPVIDLDEARLKRKPFWCRLGWHDWKLSNGTGFTRGDSPMVILFDKDCRRCGKHEEGAMKI